MIVVIDNYDRDSSVGVHVSDQVNALFQLQVGEFFVYFDHSKIRHAGSPPERVMAVVKTKELDITTNTASLHLGVADKYLEQNRQIEEEKALRDSP